MTNDFENQLDNIRTGLYEQTKHMNSTEAVKAINENGRKIAHKYGITIVKSAGRDPVPNAKAQ